MNKLSSSSPVADEVMQRLKERLREHGYVAGTRLPSERELAAQLGASRQSVREALRTLTMMGVTETKRGSGTVISASGENLLQAPLEFMLRMDRPDAADVYEIRELIEVHGAGRAAERRTDSDLVAIESALLDLESGILEDSDANVRFHAAIARASHNPVLARLMDSLTEGIRICLEETRESEDEWAKSRIVHREIFEAIRDGKPEVARSAMLRHMELAGESLSRNRIHESPSRVGRYPAPNEAKTERENAP